MSSKRIWGITIFGAAIVVCVFIVVLTVSHFRRADGEIELPDTSVPAPSDTVTDTGEGSFRPVEVTSATVQEVIRTLSRPAQYTRELKIESFWNGGSAVYDIVTSVNDNAASLRILSGGVEKRIIVADDTLYIWYQGDTSPYIGSVSSSGDGYHTSDEWQMMLTYEDVLNLSKDDILDAGFTDYGGESCIYVVFKSKNLGYVTRCYVSIEYGLITGSEEYDGETPVSTMTSGAIITEEPDESLFTLPDGTQVPDGSTQDDASGSED